MGLRALPILVAVLVNLCATAAQPRTDKAYTYNSRGQITSTTDSAHPESNATYAYDANGNRISKTQGSTTTTYQWDARDRLTGVSRDGFQVAKYRYDSQGRRVEKETFTSPATLLRFQYAGPWLESESNIIGNTIARYIRAADGKLIGYQYLNVVRNVTTDGMGTPIALMTPQGAVVARYSYDAWGNRQQADGSEDIPIGHTGYYFDRETGLYYAGARYYDPATAAFINEDPVDGDVERPITLNRYVAFNANPTVYTDPDGRCGVAVMDLGECINNVAAAERWTPEETLLAQQIQYESEARSGPSKFFNTITLAFGGPLIRGTISAGLSAYAATGSVRWGLAAASSRAVPAVEAVAQVAANVPGPGLVPTPQLASNALRAESMMYQEGRAAAAYVDDVPRAIANLPDPPPYTPTATASVVMEGSQGSSVLAPAPGTGPVGATGPPGRVLSMETGPYSVMKDRADIPGQAHHINQDSIYRDRIPHGDAVTVKLEGNAFTEPGTPHYLVHQAQEEFLNQFRRGGARFGDPPTNLEMTKSVAEALRRAGYTQEQSMALAQAAIQDRVKYGLLGGELIPRLPGRINQKKPDPANEQ